MDDTYEVMPHPQNVLEDNLSAQDHEDDSPIDEDGYAIFSASGFAIFSPSGFAIF